MEKLRLKEAILFAKSQGKAVNKLDLAKALWPDSSDSTARANLCNLEACRCKKIDMEHVSILCKALGVSSDYLFGLTENPRPVSAKITVVPEIISETIEKLTEAQNLLK